MTKKSPSNEQRMLARLDWARDSDASLSELEAREILIAEGVDAVAEYRMLLEALSTRQDTKNERQEADRKKRLADADSAYRALEQRRRVVTPRSREDNMSRIQNHQSRQEGMSAHFKGLTHMSDGDLQSLADQLDELGAHEETEMAIVIKDVPPGHNWGWFSREDPRMHIQTVDKAHLNHYKVWLEQRGQRVFQVDKQPPPDVEALLRAAVTWQRAEIDAAWISHMINKQWITMQIAQGMITLRVYPNTAHEFVRQIDLAEHIPQHAQSITSADVEFSQDPVSIVVWPKKTANQQEHIDLTDVVFID